MGIVSWFKRQLKGERYLITREVLAEFVNDSMKFSSENDLSAVDEFYIHAYENDYEEHVVITNNDATCDCPLESEIGLTGFSIYVNRTSFYDPEKDEVYKTVEELIDVKLQNYPKWFYLRHDISSHPMLEQYKI